MSFDRFHSRRRFVQGLTAAGVYAALPLRASPGTLPQATLQGTRFDLSIGETPANFTGRTRTAIAVNNSIPAPLLRWKEGSTVNVRVRNALPRGSMHGDVTSIHWHGIVLPANMDGVPGISFDGIGLGEAYDYRFEVRQAGTYWYHSHSGFQEQAGLYGPLIIDPIAPAPFAYDREHVVMLTDWTDLDPSALFARMKKMPGYDNYYKRTVGDFARDVRRDGMSKTLADRRMWGGMRMTPTDVSDINANTYTYLMNGATSLGNWTGLFRHGEKVLLRIINGSSMTYFDVRIPGLKITVVAADGQNVHPVTVDQFRIAAAETFDVIVEPAGQDAFTIFAQDMGHTGFVAGTLAVREGLHAPIPERDARAILTMTDMGHGAMSHAMAGMEGMDHAAMGHAMPMPVDTTPHHPASESHNPFVDMQVSAPAPRLDDPGIGLRDNGRTVLTYSMLRSLFDDPDGREPGREIELHLTGHMERFAWGFDGLKFSQVEPLRLTLGERVRIVLVNDTMMTHPIHLHGMWSDVEDESGEFMVRKHTVDMPPGTRRSYRVLADAQGGWAYHCHLLFHMEAGMMREVRVDA